jgi:uncharacterized repeat protein (TIGR01451 family)
MHRAAQRAARPRSRPQPSRFAFALIGVAVAGAAQPPPQAPRPDLVVSSMLERITGTVPGTGTVALEPTAGNAGSHAEELIYNVVFSNVGGKLLDGVRITSPVPADMRYVAGTASGPGGQALFSVDQARTFGRPEELTVATADGRARRADAADYTHVRFVLDAPIDAGTTGTVRFRVVPR